MLYAIVTWIYDKLTGKDHKLRYYTPDGKIRGKTLLRLGILAEDWDVSLEVLHELEDMINFHTANLRPTKSLGVCRMEIYHFVPKAYIF